MILGNKLKKKFWLSLYILLGTLINPGLAGAHAFSQEYTLPLPLSIFLYGGAGAIAVSFLIIGLFLNEKKMVSDYKVRDITKFGLVRWLTSSIFRGVLKWFSLLFLLLLIASGIFGTQFSLSNISPIFVWVIFMLGFTYLVALFGNFWPAVNPWKTIGDWVGEDKGVLSYPKVLSYWPALILYFLFIWNEIVSGEASIPRNLSTIILGYSFINVLGSYLFGLRDWFKYGEFFSVFFDLVGRMSPFEARGGKILLRPPLVGLLAKPAEGFSQVVFILFMLSSTAFDGFQATSSWLSLDLWAYEYYQGLGDGGERLFKTFGLMVSPVVLLGTYLLTIYLSRVATKSKQSFKSLAFSFAPSLLPIALVYNIAHYFQVLATQGQGIIYLISDPLGQGWNIFGTANYQVDVGILRADTVWYTQVGFIVLGHIAAVYLAHLIALKIFKSQKLALVSQVPMLLLMVGYTLAGLWLLAQPISFGT